MVKRSASKILLYFSLFISKIQTKHTANACENTHNKWSDFNNINPTLRSYRAYIRYQNTTETLKWFKDVFLSFENSIRGMGLGLCSERPDSKHGVCTHCREYISFVNIDSSQTFENLPVIRTCIAFRDEGIRWELWVYLYSLRGSKWEEISWWLITGYNNSYNIHRQIRMVESCFSLYIIIFLCLYK